MTWVWAWRKWRVRFGFCLWIISEIWLHLHKLLWSTDVGCCRCHWLLLCTAQSYNWISLFIPKWLALTSYRLRTLRCVGATSEYKDTCLMQNICAEFPVEIHIFINIISYFWYFSQNVSNLQVWISITSDFTSVKSQSRKTHFTRISPIFPVLLFWCIRVNVCQI